jgi:hypothetical protein
MSTPALLNERLHGHPLFLSGTAGGFFIATTYSR